MKTLIAILIIVSFLESTILPVDLVLIILIGRSFIKEEKENLYLGFGFGLLLSLLNGNYLGFQSITYLMVVFLTHLISRSRLAKNSFLVVPLNFMFLSLNEIVLSLMTNQSMQLFPKVILETLLSIPIFALLKVWEERFIVRKEIKLRVK